MNAKIVLRIDEPDTRIRREILSDVQLHPDSIAGLQVGDKWILYFGHGRIEASGTDLIGIAHLILGKLNPRA